MQIPPVEEENDDLNAAGLVKLHMWREERRKGGFRQDCGKIQTDGFSDISVPLS